MRWGGDRLCQTRLIPRSPDGDNNDDSDDNDGDDDDDDDNGGGDICNGAVCVCLSVTKKLVV